MASVLSLPPQGPFKRSFSDNHSYPSLMGDTIGTLRAITSRNVSACSLFTITAIGPGEWLAGRENTPPPLTSRSVEILNLGHDKVHRELDVRYIDPAGPSCDTEPRMVPCTLPSANQGAPPVPRRVTERTEAVQSSDPHIEASDPQQYLDDKSDGSNDTEFFDLDDSTQSPLPNHRGTQDLILGNSPAPEYPLEPLEAPPFRRWISILRRRHLRRGDGTLVDPLKHDFGECSPDQCSTTSLRAARSHPPRSDSASSSLGFVTTVKTASLTLSGASITRLRTRTSTLSEVRRSIDSNASNPGPTLDESAWLRALQRRRIVEEIVSSEESYIADLKILANDYFALASSILAICTQTRTCIQRNINQILQLHQDLLSELHHVVPHAEFTHSVAQQEGHPAARAKHVRFHSVDLIPGEAADKSTRRLRRSLELGRARDARPEALTTDTITAGNIAKVFNAHMRRFFVYEEYGAHWTTLSKDLATMCKDSQGWSDYERAIEAISKLVISDNNRVSGSRKALAFSDLLIKPIQRVCKYPLLFNELRQKTPVCDDPEAHAELEKAVFRLQETIREVNKAKDDPKARKLLEISWQLQDRLDFQTQTPSRVHNYHSLGQVLVCGVLHVAYQGSERVKGQYMICILYRSCILLATANRSIPRYTVVAAIPLANATVEESDNGRGLQCHTAPYTWKVMFEHGHRLHEALLSACSAEEEEVWRRKLQERIVCETHGFVEGQTTAQDISSFLALDINPIGPVFGHADSLVRRMSVHRSVTLRAKPCTTQVIIKNTQAQRISENPAPSVTRSQSFTSTTHVPTLAPRRGERVRLEAALEDVWTKDILPFPGMSNRSVEDQIRASANSVMRKLSVASIASNFSRRSPSVSSIRNAHSEEFGRNRVHRKTKSDTRSRTTMDQGAVPVHVDFHDPPAACLPTDMELQGLGPVERRRWTADPPGGAECVSHGPGEGDARRDLTHMLDARRPSTASSGTMMHKPERRVPLQQNDKRKNTDPRGIGPAKSACNDLQRTKSLKNKGTLFKFWM